MQSRRLNSAPFSAHARGVPLFDRTAFTEISDQGARALLDLRDIGSSGFWFASCLSWTALWSVLINILSVVFFTYYDKKYQLSAPIDWSIPGLLVIIPMLGFTWIAYVRRNRCLDMLSEFKSTTILLLNAFHNWMKPLPSLSEDALPSGQSHRALVSVGTIAGVHEAVESICDAMHEYFLPARFYSKRFPYFGYKSVMIQIAMERSKHQNVIRNAMLRLDESIAALRGVGLPMQLEALLHERILRLFTLIDQMSNVKEFGSPQGIRSMAYYFVLLIIPLFFGPYWSFIGKQTDFAFAFFFSSLVQILLSGLLQVYLTMEDPWDNSGLGGIFIDEQLHDIEVALSSFDSDRLHTRSNLTLPSRTNGGLWHEGDGITPKSQSARRNDEDGEDKAVPHIHRGDEQRQQDPVDARTPTYKLATDIV